MSEHKESVVVVVVGKNKFQAVTVQEIVAPIHIKLIIAYSLKFWRCILQEGRKKRYIT